ncbi:hypothetical protein [Nocardioides sp. AX2bis]|uniref:hypothetical protein n=1 Tax=Nocardioides sp. AX2bis TaxID=2653157 RepID=UPI0012F223B3|nr:hypothetical protein [Nocardioides sp. AX2bis]VXB76707.1 conserved exported hypothetical protein [Nocardioides sp. AX2bis]
MRHRSSRTAVPAALTALLLATMSACGADTGADTGGDAPDPGGTTTDLARTDPAVDELAAQDGRPCPARLPGRDDDAFGGTDPAASAPDLAAPDRAWVCRYQLADGAEGAAWTRQTRPQQVAADRLPDLAAALAELAPADDGRLCTEELGPRYLLVLAADGDAGTDLTGVAVDGFGCRDVRLTDDPSTTAPGEASAPGVVPGVLTAPDDLVEVLTSGGLTGR